MIDIDWIQVQPKQISLREGDLYYIQQILFCPRYATNRDVIWSSTNSEIAAYDSSKQCIVAKSAGTAKISIISAVNPNVKESICVKVTKKTMPKSTIKINTKVLYLQKGEQATVSAEIKPIQTKNIIWNSTNKEVATVENGIITANASGYTSIRATIAENDGLTDYCDVYVTEDVLVKQITVTPKNLALRIGDTECICKSIYPANATNKNVEWKSSNSDVVTVDAKSGIITAKSAGFATVMVAALDGSKKYDTCNIRVNI